MYKIMTAGPTQVRENVRNARSLITTNPDIDGSFVEEYKGICDKLKQIMNSSGEAYILGGEGILGLEAACASLTEAGDRVLVIDNGIFGKGFADFVKMYGGEPVLYTTDYRQPIDVAKLETYLSEDDNFKYATVVHCDTPSGMNNPIDKICQLLSQHGILTVVDSVAGMFGEPVDVDGSEIDILCGGSQKALSAPPGLAMVWVSDRAMNAMGNRKTPIASFYANLLNFRNYYEEKWFPYTMPISDIKGLGVAVDNVIEDTQIIERHKQIAQATRKAIVEAGLKLYGNGGFSNTVTVFEVPKGVTDSDILKVMRDDYGIMISGSFDLLAGKVLRIGHMGENANVTDVAETLKALEGALRKLGVEIQGDMAKIFKDTISM